MSALTESMQTRAMLLASFYASCRGTRPGGAMPMTAASCAGLLLHSYRTTRAAMEACAAMPGDGPWPLAGRYLAELADAEGADTVPPQSLTVGR